MTINQPCRETKKMNIETMKPNEKYHKITYTTKVNGLKTGFDKDLKKWLKTAKDE